MDNRQLLGLRIQRYVNQQRKDLNVNRETKFCSHATLANSTNIIMHPPNPLAGSHILHTEESQESQTVVKGNSHPPHFVSLLMSHPCSSN